MIKQEGYIWEHERNVENTRCIPFDIEVINVAKNKKHGFSVLHSDKNRFWPIRASAGAYLCYKHFLKLFMSWIVYSNL